MKWMKSLHGIFFGAIILIVFAGGIVFIYETITRGFDAYEEDKFCDRVHKPIDGYRTTTDDKIEKGYLQCCRYVYIEHVKEKDCKIFKYEK